MRPATRPHSHNMKFLLLVALASFTTADKVSDNNPLIVQKHSIMSVCLKATAEEERQLAAGLGTLLGALAGNQLAGTDPLTR